MNINKIIEKAQSLHLNSKEFKDEIHAKVKTFWSNILGNTFGQYSKFAKEIENEIESKIKIGEIDINSALILIEDIIKEEHTNFNEHLTKKVRSRIRKILLPFEDKKVTLAEISEMLGIVLGSCDFITVTNKYDFEYKDIKVKIEESQSKYSNTIRFKLIIEDLLDFGDTYELLRFSIYDYQDKNKLTIGHWEVASDFNYKPSSRTYEERFSVNGAYDFRGAKRSEPTLETQRHYENEHNPLIRSFYYKPEPYSSCICDDEDDIKEKKEDLVKDAFQYIKDVFFKIDIEDIELVKSNEYDCNKALQDAFKKSQYEVEFNSSDDD